MNKFGIYIALISILVLSSATIEKSGCDVRILKNELLKELRPDFKYDSSNINRFILEGKQQGTEVKVPLFSGESYKMLFNTAALPANFEIQIYDKQHDASNRKLLFSIKSSEETGKHVFVFEPKKPQTMYIDYILPGVEGQNEHACVVFLMGYKIN